MIRFFQMIPQWFDDSMILYTLRFIWVASRGYRLCPWRSPYLRWRLETYSGIPADRITGRIFRVFLWRERRELWRLLRWGAEMRRLERSRRNAARPASQLVK